MAQDEVRVAWEPLQEFTKEVFVRAGLPPQDAQIEAEVLVWANLRGIDSHGVLRIPSYLRFVEAGDMNPRPDIQIVKQTCQTPLRRRFAEMYSKIVHSSLDSKAVFNQVLVLYMFL